MKRVNGTSKVIKSGEWIGDKIIKNRKWGTKTKAKEFKSLTSAVMEISQRWEVKNKTNCHTIRGKEDTIIETYREEI